jgi:hypothetical protein
MNIINKRHEHFDIHKTTNREKDCYITTFVTIRYYEL